MTAITNLYPALEQQYQLPVGWLAAIEGAESSGDTAVSPKGARGRFQFMPATAARFGLTDPTDPVQSAVAAAKYGRYLSDLFSGDPTLMLAGYNAGEGAVQRHQGIPPYPETQNYVRRGMGILRQIAESIIPAASAEEPAPAAGDLSALEKQFNQPFAAPTAGAPAPAPAGDLSALQAQFNQQSTAPTAATPETPGSLEELKKQFEQLPTEPVVENPPPPPPPPPNVPGSLSSVGQGIKSELNRGWQGLQRFVANVPVADISGPQTVIADTPEEQAADAAANAWNAALVNRKTGQALQAQETEDQPYQQAHPWLFKGGNILGGLIESAPLMPFMPAVPAVAPIKAGVGAVLSSLGKRALADMLIGSGTGALLTPLQAIPGETSEEYRVNLANALAGNAATGAVAGPLADVAASGIIGSVRGAIKGVGKLGQLLVGNPNEALSPQAQAAVKQYNLYTGAGDVTGSPILQKAENLLANYQPLSGIPKKYAKGVEQAEAAAQSQRGQGAIAAGMDTAQEISDQAAARIEAQKGEVLNFANRFTPPGGLSADQGIQAGAQEQLAANRQVIRRAYDKVRDLLESKGLEDTKIPAPATQQAVTALLDELPEATRKLAPSKLTATLDAIANMKPGESGFTFNEMRDLDRRLGSLLGAAKREKGGIGDELSNAFGSARAALHQDMENWGSASGNTDIVAALREAKQAWIKGKLPYTHEKNPVLNKALYADEPEGTYGKLFKSGQPEHAAASFNLLSANGQQSAKYGLLGDILQASEKNGQFDRAAFLKASRERSPLIGKMLSPAEQKSFGDIVERINQNRGSPGLEAKANRAIVEEDPVDLMKAITARDVRVQRVMAKLSPDGKQAVADYVIDTAFTGAKDNISGDFSLMKFASALGNNAEVLKQAGRWDELRGLAEVFKQTQRITQLSADPPTGQRVVTATAMMGGAWAAFTHPYLLISYLGAGRAMSALLTNPYGRDLLAGLGRLSTVGAKIRMQEPAWQRQFIKVLESVSSQPNNRPK